MLEQGRADFVALGRPLLADPDFASKTRKGEERDIRPCIGCHECLGRIRKRQALSCAVNPQCGDEERLAIRPAMVRKKVIVIGGGIAGMEAARVSAARGHDVTLYEKSDRLGGTLHVAGKADFKQDIHRLLEYQVRQVELQGNIKIRLSTEATEGIVTSEKPDVIFVATGSRPINETAIPGLKEMAWVTPDDVYGDNVPAGENACIVGGGSVGCETALYLAEKGWSVTVVEMLAEVATDLHEANREMLLEMLSERGVQVRTGTEVDKVVPGAVQAKSAAGRIEVPADLLVLAIGRRPETRLAEAMRRLPKEVYVVGDCAVPRKIKDAVWEAFKLALTV
jgi:2-enoate reductase